ncbi:hypothetical protein LINPERPRIM_LOCUS31045, partial [Linum perenne]
SAKTPKSSPKTFNKYITGETVDRCQFFQGSFRRKLKPNPSRIRLRYKYNWRPENLNLIPAGLG